MRNKINVYRINRLLSPSGVRVVEGGNLNKLLSFVVVLKSVV